MNAGASAAHAALAYGFDGRNGGVPRFMQASTVRPVPTAHVFNKGTKWSSRLVFANRMSCLSEIRITAARTGLRLVLLSLLIAEARGITALLPYLMISRAAVGRRGTGGRRCEYCLVCWF
jgi:hypothetical protein